MKKLSIKLIIVIIIVVAISKVIFYMSPKGQYLEIKDKTGTTYKAIFHKGTLSYAVFVDEDNPDKRFLFVIWRWNIESVKVLNKNKESIDVKGK